MTDQAPSAGVSEWEALREQGRESARKGELSKALDRLSGALNLYRSTGEVDLLGDFLAEIGEVHMELGHLDEAIDCFKQGLRMDGLAPPTRRRATSDGLRRAIARRTGL
jgi:tetratricopeptide (TPR) repeat protein